MIATCLGAANVPISFDQSWKWCERWLPNGKQFYVVGIATTCWSIWKIRNKVCFDGKTFRNPIEIICHACALMKYWAGLQKEGDKEVLIQGVETMIKIALQFANEEASGGGSPNLLPDSADEGDAE
jgi:hypothetical protein